MNRAVKISRANFMSLLGCDRVHQTTGEDGAERRGTVVPKSAPIEITALCCFLVDTQRYAFVWTIDIDIQS